MTVEAIALVGLVCGFVGILGVIDLALRALGMDE